MNSKYIKIISNFLTHHSICRGIFFLLITLALIFLRARDRILNPQVWDEDAGINPGWYGTDALPNLLSYIKNGFESLLLPVNGYLILTPKLITIISSSISIYYYPLLSTGLAWLCITAVCHVIATAPLRLNGGFILAIACLLIPSDPEVFGLPLYTFWWISLLPLLFVFWNSHSNRWIIRSIGISLAALSSPVIIAILPLYIFRAWLYRTNKIEIALAIWATLWTSAQLAVMFHAGSLGASSGNINTTALTLVIPTFLGSYMIGNLYNQWIWAFGIALLFFLIVGLYRNRHSWVMWALSYLWIVAVLMSISRVNIGIIHPALAGPRYFFYPFVLMSWFLIQMAFAERIRWISNTAWLVLVFSMLNTIPVLGRKHDDLKWQAHLDSCRYFSDYMIPVHFNGDAALAWSMPITGKYCSDLLDSDLFFSQKNRPTFPYRIVGKYKDGIVAGLVPKIGSVIINDWRGSDYYSKNSGQTTLPGWRVFGSFDTSENDSGEISLHLHRGEQVWFRSEPKSVRQRIIVEGGNGQYLENLPATSEWVLLEFSNIKLPNEFTVRFVDGGGGWGEWSAIGINLIE